jgi:HK97 family phage portal protein
MAGLFGAVARPRAEINTLTMEEWARRQGGGTEAKTGIYVSPESALRYTTVLSCVRVLSESVASLPCILYKRRKDGGKDRATDHPTYRVLHDQANAWNTAFEYFEGTMVNLVMRGNGYSYVERDRNGRVIGLVPLNPEPVTVTQARDWTPKYEVTLPDNTRAKLSSKEIHHICGPVARGYVGRSMISLAKEAIGLGMAAESFGANLYRNGVKPSGALEHPKKIGAAAADALRTQFADKYAGLDNSGKPLVLEEGMKWVSMSIAPKDAEFLESRKFQRSEIAGIFRVPLHMIGDLDRSTNNNIEHQSLEFVRDSLRPWLKRAEAAINRDLLLPSERDEYFAEFLMDDMLRGDFKARMEGYALGIQNGIWNPDEVRIKESSNRREDGQGGEYWRPTNMYPPSDGGTIAAPDVPAKKAA